jgi:hypothetical protein
MFNRKKIKMPKPHNQLTTMDLVRQYLMSRIPQPKVPASQPIQAPQETPSGISINHIAIILDGRVEDVIRCQNRLAALLLSDPEFVEFNPEEVRPKAGITEYLGGEFVNPKVEEPPILTQEEIDKILLDVSGPEALNDKEE